MRFIEPIGVILLGALAACGPSTGEEGGPCNNNGVCVSDLVCVDGLCQFGDESQRADEDGSGEGGATGEGEASPGEPNNDSPETNSGEEAPTVEVYGRWEVRNSALVLDRETGRTWTRDDEGCCYDAADGAAFCRQLAGSAEYGISNWRLPKIQELRSIIDGCPSGGSGCQVSDPQCLDSDLCWSDACDRCAQVGGAKSGPGRNGCYRTANVWTGRCEAYISASEGPHTGEPGCSNSGGGCTPDWFVNFAYGWVYRGGPFSGSSGYVLCVSDG